MKLGTLIVFYHKLTDVHRPSQSRVTTPSISLLSLPHPPASRYQFARGYYMLRLLVRDLHLFVAPSSLQ